jgi:hypothetical protein
LAKQNRVAQNHQFDSVDSVQAFFQNMGCQVGKAKQNSSVDLKWRRIQLFRETVEQTFDIKVFE